MLIHNTIGKTLAFLALGCAASLLLPACASETASPAAQGPKSPQAAQAPADAPKFAINVQKAQSQGITVADIAQAMNDFLKTHPTIHQEDLQNITVQDKDPSYDTGKIHHLNEFVTIK